MATRPSSHPAMPVSPAPAAGSTALGVEDPLLARKPMTATRRVSLFQREVRVYLSAPAIELLFELAEAVSEGAQTGAEYFGSTMLRIDLARARAALRDPCDATDALHTAELLVRDPRFRARARMLALAAAADRTEGTITQADVDLAVRAEGTVVLVDLDVQARLAGPPPSPLPRREVE